MILGTLQHCERFLMRRGFSPAQRLGLVFGLIVGLVVLAYWSINNRLSSKQVYGDAGNGLKMLSPERWKKQAQLDYLAGYLHVSYETISNLGEDGHSARITLHNTGTEAVTRWDWSIYFYSKNHISSQGVNGNGPAKVQMRLTHVNGDLFRMAPTDNFKEISPGDTLEVAHRASAWLVARTDVNPNWIVSAPGLQAQVLKSTAGESLSFIKPFNLEAQWKRSANDLVKPFTPESRYHRCDAPDLGAASSLVVPTPFHVSYERSKSVVINDKWVIVVREGVEHEAKYLSAKLRLPIQDHIPEDHYILLNLGGVALTPDQLKNEEEAYTLNSFGGDKEQILIGANTPTGIFYGIQTLLNMMDLDTGAVLHANIQDVPRYSYRGLMVDVARNFLPKADVMKLIEAMAVYKLNKLHLHLTDDEGWRLQIPDLGELTEVGVRKGFDLTERSSLLPYLGSGVARSVAGSGFYTVQDYKEILRYAADRHVTVIPEFDMPGHGHAAIRSMEARAIRLIEESTGDAAVKYLLSDPKDKSQSMSVQHFKNNAINPCMESTYQFVEHVMQQVIDMHKGIQELKTWHFGGDEFPSKAYEKSPACITFRESNPHRSTPSALKAYFVERVSDLAQSHGLKLQGWEDGFYAEKAINDRLVSKENVANAWYNVWENGKAHRAHELANAGFQVVLTHVTHLYFDHPQEPDPEERGLYWATRYIDTQRVLGYTPLDIFSNIEGSTNYWGEPITQQQICNQHKCPPLEKPDNIIGLEGAVWGETVRNGEHLHHMAFPRLLALAERSWHQAAWEGEGDAVKREEKKRGEWAQFANTLGYRELRRLETIGVDYRLPVPGAIVEDGHLKVNCELPGVVIQYSTDGGRTWQDWKADRDTGPAGNILLATRSFDGNRRGRSIQVSI